MSAASPWTELTAAQLVRYEALFGLLDDIQTLEDVAEISRLIATRWKYFANVSSWRLVVAMDGGFQVIDALRGEVQLAEVSALSPWDRHHWAAQRPCLVRPTDDPLLGVSPPAHLTGTAVTEIAVLPVRRAEGCLGLLSLAARCEAFAELDQKFIKLFAGYFTDRISGILLRRQAMEVLVSKATRDALTGLLNRGTVIERLGDQLALSARTGQPLSVVIADLDFFKVINDSYGHLAGDEVLREASARLQSATREGDSVGRYGGEEFLFVLYPCGPQEAVRTAERFRRAIADTVFTVSEVPRGFGITISAGTSCTAGQDGIAMPALLKQADDALYRSKAGGRNRVTAAGASPRERRKSRPVVARDGR